MYTRTTLRVYPWGDCPIPKRGSPASRKHIHIALGRTFTNPCPEELDLAITQSRRACVSLRARYRVLPRDGSVRTTKTSRVIARAMAGGLLFVAPCPNKQGKNAYFFKVSDACSPASDVVNIRKDGKHFGPPPIARSLSKNKDLLADLFQFFCSGSAVQQSLWAKLEKGVPVSEVEKKRCRTEAANTVTPLSVVDLVLLLKIPRRRYYCARFACEIVRISAHSTLFVDFCARYVLMLRALFCSGTKI